MFGIQIYPRGLPGRFARAAWCAGFGVVLACVAPVGSAGGSQLLDRYLASLQSVEAHFVQQLFDEDERLVEESEGEFYLQRPDRFRWNYQAPAKQQIVCDGDQVWVYDEELAQVVVRPIGDMLGNSPAALLSSDQPADTWFELEEEGKPSFDGLRWVRAVPRNPDSAFALLRLGFSGEELSRFEMRDNFGQTTRLDFTRSRLNPRLDPALFQFDIPPGTDVIRDVHE